jgi:hypothetical protein
LELEAAAPIPDLDMQGVPIEVRPERDVLCRREVPMPDAVRDELADQQASVLEGCLGREPGQIVHGVTRMRNGLRPSGEVEIDDSHDLAVPNHAGGQPRNPS